jgi:hypothetical protein
MTDEHVDQLLSELRTSLDVEPSAGFAVGVRTRIAEATASRGMAFWWPIVAVASAGAIVAAVAVMTRGSSVPAAPRSAPAAAVAPAVEPTPVASSAQPLAPVTPIAPAAPRVARRTLARATTQASSSPSSLEVITNQGQVLQAMWRRAGSGNGTLKEVEPEPASATTAGPVTPPTEAIVVPPVTIDPIVISTLGGGSSSGGATPPNGSTIRRADAGRN